MKTSDSDLKVNRNIYSDAVNVIGCVGRKKLLVCEKNVAASSCCGKVL